MSIIDDIIALEWRFFDKVQNEGGRASCQNDFETFEIMRKSQFLAWDEATLTAYLDDLMEAARLGRNVIQEKYARMMASTAPRLYAQFAHLLPPLNAWQRQTIEEIVAIQIAWREDFAREWPLLSEQARLIHSSEDTPDETSFETYLRGELGTYSETMLAAYRGMIEACRARGGNLTTETMLQTVRLYGYQDLESAVRSIKNR